MELQVILSNIRIMIDVRCMAELCDRPATPGCYTLTSIYPLRLPSSCCGMLVDTLIFLTS